MDQHHNQVETNIPELCGMMFTSFEKPIQFDSLVAAFRRSPLIIHQLPIITFSWGRCIEPDVGLHRNGAGSAILGVRTRVFTSTDAIVIQRAAELGILAM